jgi:hypothetical protein
VSQAEAERFVTGKFKGAEKKQTGKLDLEVIGRALGSKPTKILPFGGFQLLSLVG